MQTHWYVALKVLVSVAVFCVSVAGTAVLSYRRVCGSLLVGVLGELRVPAAEFVQKLLVNKDNESNPLNCA